MKTARTPFLEALLTIKPAVATKELIEECCFVWFDGKHLMAYNDAELGIQVPVETDFKGGVRGSLLLGLLQNSRAKDIVLEPSPEKVVDQDSGSIYLKAARTKAQLSVLPIERSPWRFPKVNRDRAFKVTDDFLEALKMVMVSVGRDTSIPETLGVTIHLGDQIVFYATDSDTMASVTVPRLHAKTDQHKSQRVIVPAAFCEQVLRICGSGSFIEFCPDCVLAGNDSGVLVYARLLASPKPLRFHETMERHSHWPKGSKFEVPERLSMALDRVAVLFEGLVGEKVTLTVGGGLLRLSAEVQGRGHLKDSVVIPETVPEITVRTEPQLIRRALELATHMVCTEEAIRLSGDKHFVYLVSTAF